MFPTYTTGRFLLRKIETTDIEQLFAGLSDPRVIRHYGVSYTTLEATYAQLDFYNDLIVKDTGIWWAICNIERPGEMLGACGLNHLNKEHHRIEIGYWLLVDHWGRGIMRECMPIVIQHAFDQISVHRIEAIVEGGNEASSKLLLSLGFEYEGTLKECEIKNGAFISLQYFALIKPVSATFK